MTRTWWVTSPGSGAVDPQAGPHESADQSFAIRARFDPPSGPDQVGSLFQLVSSDGNQVFYAEVDVDGVWFQFIDQGVQAKGVSASYGMRRDQPVDVDFVWDLAAEQVEGGSILAAALTVCCGFAKTRSEARRLIAEKGVRLEGEPLPDPQGVVTVRTGQILQRGKRKFVRLVLD